MINRKKVKRLLEEIGLEQDAVFPKMQHCKICNRRDIKTNGHTFDCKLKQALAIVRKPTCQLRISDVAIPCPDNGCCGILKVEEYIDRPTCNECGKVYVLVEDKPACEKCESAKEIIAKVAKAQIEEKYGSVANAITETCKPTIQQVVGSWAAQMMSQSTNESICEHLRREVAELSTSHLAEEAADCLMILLHFAYKNGFDLLAEAAKKHTINTQREWGEPDEQGVVEHIRKPTCKTCKGSGKKYILDSRYKTSAYAPPEAITEIPCPDCPKTEEPKGYIARDENG